MIIIYNENGKKSDENDFSIFGQTKNIKFGDGLFYSNNTIVDLNKNFDSLLVSNQMFARCENLQSFQGNLNSLVNGTQMFQDCSKLSSFTGDLHSLKTGYKMFDGCVLNADSIEKISESLSDLTILEYGDDANWTYDSKIIDINKRGVIHIDWNNDVNQKERVESYFRVMVDKGWDVCLDGSEPVAVTVTFGDDGEIVEAELGGLIDGDNFFSCCSNITSFDYDLSSLTSAREMFYNCSKLTSFNSDLSSLTDGYHMFSNTALTSFDSDLSSLTNGANMFYRTNLTSFDSDLSSLTNGTNMFYRTNLTSFDSDLSSLTNGDSMFHDCTALTSFDSDLSSLTNGYGMFGGCSNITSFNSDLSSLTYGYYMFSNCKLDTPSVQKIADTINTTTNKTIHIGIGESSANAEIEAAIAAIEAKGWQPIVQYNA